MLPVGFAGRVAAAARVTSWCNLLQLESLANLQTALACLRRYRSGFLWGVLGGWQRPQGDALVHLGTERRGCLSLPDADCCYLPVGTRTACQAIKNHPDRLCRMMPSRCPAEEALYTLRLPFAAQALCFHIKCSGQLCKRLQGKESALLRGRKALLSSCDQRLQALRNSPCRAGSM